MAFQGKDIPRLRDSLKRLIELGTNVDTAQNERIESDFLIAINAGLVGTSASSEIPDGSITSDKIADGGVAGRNIGLGAVGTSNISDKAVTKGKLSQTLQDAIDAIGTGEEPTGEIPESRFGDKTISNSALKDNSVDTRVLADASVGADNIKAMAVSRAKLAQELIDELDKIGTTTELEGQIVSYDNFNTQLQAFVDAFFTRSDNTAKLPASIVTGEAIGENVIAARKLTGLTSLSSTDDGKTLVYDHTSGGLRLATPSTNNIPVTRGVRYGFVATNSPSRASVDALPLTMVTSVTMGTNPVNYRLIFAAIHERITSITIGGIDVLSGFDTISITGYTQVLVSARELLQDVYNNEVITFTVVDDNT